ncbi:MAG: hypothetical protein WDO71_18960 [Bacteroidota bacterium]
MFRLSWKRSFGGKPQSGYPSLVNIDQKRDKDFVDKLVVSGKGMMPGLPYISDEQRRAVIAFLFNEEKKEVKTTAITNGKPFLPYINMQDIINF